MSFKMPTGKKLDSMLDKLSAKDIKEIRAQFELDVQKEKKSKLGGMEDEWEKQWKDSK